MGYIPPFLIKRSFMSAQARSEFSLALNQVCSERGIDPEIVLETIKAAIVAAYRKDFGIEGIEDIQIELNSDNGEAKIIKNEKDITPPGFGRIAAQTAKQVILQRIREAEKKAIIMDYSDKVGSLVNGMVLRFDNNNVVVDIGKTEALMPPSDQLPSEHYRLNQKLVFYIVGIREGVKGGEIIVSRVHKGLIEGLFKREVPEVQSKAVVIKEIAREGGYRSKVAVISNQAGVDPVGSCVGQKGVRIQAIINELGGQERIDIIQYNDDPLKYIASALAPAKDLEIILDIDNKSAIAKVANEQLSLAIGKDGQNVRLAVKLTGWKIDLKSKSEKEIESKETSKEVIMEDSTNKFKKPVKLKKIKSSVKDKKVKATSQVKKTKIPKKKVK